MRYSGTMATFSYKGKPLGDIANISKWHTHYLGYRYGLPGGGSFNLQWCDGTPSDCPKTALRKARGTMNHIICAPPHDKESCLFWTNTPADHETWEDAESVFGYAASALLEGFTVEEITEAGG